jgi:hypothetical protein
MLTDTPAATLKESDLAGTYTRTATITINSTQYRLIKPLPMTPALASRRAAHPVLRLIAWAWCGAWAWHFMGPSTST